MTTFAWRQFHTQAAIAAGALLAAAVVLAITGPHLVHVYDAAVAACKASGVATAACPNPVTSVDKNIQLALGAVLLVFPVLIGMFWGAPLVSRELETGTFRLAWTQSVTRNRWLTTKLWVVGSASALTAALLSLMAMWWLNPINEVSLNRFSPGLFGLQGIVPIGYAVFAFALGITTGLLFRRTLPAMAVTFVAFIGARLAVTFWLRPRLISPVSLNVPVQQASGFGFAMTPSGPEVVTSAPSLPNAWVYSTNVVNKAGQSPTSAFFNKFCPTVFSGLPPSGGGGPFTHSVAQAPPKAQGAFQQCITTIAAKYHEVVVYQPANRFWTFQVYETLIFVGLAALLAGLCFWWVRRRLS